MAPDHSPVLDTAIPFCFQFFNTQKAFSLGNVLFLVTLLKLEWVLSTALVVYMILRMALP
ncbi:hypothetical protein J6TS1_06320 [Siminovitchia terrae]|uniref:Uncharacterized protein n=1 Tax=Siminovitchia terrae TaxID=1914933 RepID=A0ABQ4KU16_SIMTE|nr:hypothetical protein J6TS1_06320 [Siminovitchia terrae]